jgi:hypothetical protein
LLDKEIIELAKKRISLELGDQIVTLSGEIKQAKEEMIARGLGRSGALLKKITDLCCNGIRKRGQLACEVLLSVIAVSNISYSDDLAEELKEIVDDYLPQSHNYVKYFILQYIQVLDPRKTDSPKKLAGYSPLDKARQIALGKVHNDIDLFLIELRNKQKITTQGSYDEINKEDQVDIFRRILLEKIQEDLFITIVEAARNTPLDKRQKFLVAQSFGGDSLIHPSIPNEKNEIYFGDIEILAGEGLLALGYGSEGTPDFDVTPLGFKYYEYLKSKLGESVERVEKTIRNYIESDNFRGNFSKVYEKWSSAEELLWETADSQQKLTTIGHLCREAVQEFADYLVDLYKPPNISKHKSKTVARLKEIVNFRSQELGETKKDFLEALIAYWGTVNDLIQRLEHGGQKEGQPLTWEDARLVVFQTLIVIVEIYRAL